MASSNNAAAGGAGAVYGMGFFGAVIWNWQQAETFWGYPWGVIESFFWPGFLVWSCSRAWRPSPAARLARPGPRVRRTRGWR